MIETNSKIIKKQTHEFLLKFLDDYVDSEKVCLRDVMEIMLCKMLMAGLSNVETLKEEIQSPKTLTEESKILRVLIEGYKKGLDAIVEEFESDNGPKH